MLSRSSAVASQWHDGTGWRTGRLNKSDASTYHERRSSNCRTECSQLDRCGGCLIMRAPFSTARNPVMFVGDVKWTMTSDCRTPFLKPLRESEQRTSHGDYYKWIDLSSGRTVNDHVRMLTAKTTASLVLEDGQIVQDHPTAGLHHQKGHDHHYPVCGGCQSRISLISEYGAVPTHYRRSPQTSVVNRLEIASPDHP